MSARPVIIDCAPGLGSAAALLLALRAPELDIRAVTTVSGHVGPDHSWEDAMKILTLSGVCVPVCPGADRPLLGEGVTADDLYGVGGLSGYPLPEPSLAPSHERAWDALSREAAAWGGALEVIAVGPLTNLAIALSKYSALPRLIRRIVIMGGAASHGNATPAAECNIRADPEAAAMVFRSGVPVVMCGLEVTHKAYLTEAEIVALDALGTPHARLAAYALRSMAAYGQRFYVPGVPVHGACAMMYALDSALFTASRCWVGVECAGRLTRGKTVTDLSSDAKETPNTLMVTGVDRPAFVRALTKRLCGSENRP